MRDTASRSSGTCRQMRSRWRTPRRKHCRRTRRARACPPARRSPLRRFPWSGCTPGTAPCTPRCSSSRRCKSRSRTGCCWYTGCLAREPGRTLSTRSSCPAHNRCRSRRSRCTRSRCTGTARTTASGALGRHPSRCISPPASPSFRRSSPGDIASPRPDRYTRCAACRCRLRRTPCRRWCRPSAVLTVRRSPRCTAPTHCTLRIVRRSSRCNRCPRARRSHWCTGAGPCTLRRAPAWARSFPPRSSSC